MSESLRLKALKRRWNQFWYRWGILYIGHVDDVRKLTQHGYFCGFTILKSHRAYLIMPLNRLAEKRYAKKIKAWGGHAKVR
jgi:hypothetical protein